MGKGEAGLSGGDASASASWMSSRTRGAGTPTLILPPSERKTSARAGGGGGRSRRRRRVREGDPRGEDRGGGAGRVDGRHVMSASARTDQQRASHAERVHRRGQLREAHERNLERVRGVLPRQLREEGVRDRERPNVQTLAPGDVRAYRRTSRTSPPSASLADADAIADVEWSRCGSTTPRTPMMDSRALHTLSDDDEHLEKQRFVNPTSTSLLHLARIRGGFDSSNFRVSGARFDFVRRFPGGIYRSGLGSRRPRAEPSRGVA